MAALVPGLLMAALVPGLLMAALVPGLLPARRAPVVLALRASARRRLEPDRCLTRTITVERETKERSGVDIA
jgi:hypothetical protein